MRLQYLQSAAKWIWSIEGSSLLQVHVDKSMLRNEALALIPQPRSVRRIPGFLELPELSAHGPSSLLRVLDEFLAPMMGTSVQEREADTALLSLHLTAGDASEESYLLNVTGQGVRLEAATEHGLFNAVMTLRQMLKKGKRGWMLPLAEIEDAPALKWRGLMLDVSRHFFEPSEVKHLLRTMALFKLNHFHWHLTDDQGWRFPVHKFPQLIRLGAYRRATQKGHEAKQLDEVPYNHSYTVEEIEDILSLAESLHIEVMPEFDLPGHSQAAIASYPELGNADISEDWHPEVATSFGALQYTLSPSEVSVNFTKDVLSEMAQLFAKSPYIHIGGDEVPTEQWSKSRRALAAAQESHVSVKKLEGLMLEKAAKHLQGLRRTAVVWDDALSGGRQLPKETVVMIWRSWEGLATVGNKAAAQGHPVVLAPQAYTYLDQWQDLGHSQFDAIGGYLPLSKVYESPTSAGEAEVLGIQGQLWSEYIREGGRNLDFMAWPRGAALAEVAWAAAARPGFADFERRLRQRREDFKLFQVNLGEI
ncbi:unnamed protein product [Effrenium voratum]|uniref:Beta-hexosaminidase n=1 Tax=Effrenium voratum TaxID=2562239 RepID=A0AA36N0C3_9DINO|nr:unnamed protein product [Effrenium voratum]